MAQIRDDFRGSTPAQQADPDGTDAIERQRAEPFVTVERPSGAPFVGDERALLHLVDLEHLTLNGEVNRHPLADDDERVIAQGNQESAGASVCGGW